MKLVIILAVSILWGCATQEADQPKIIKREISQQFKDYWYDGTAEINSYELQQSRYGQLHQGHAVLIFVTEDFSRSKQVKLDGPGNAVDDKASVLKLNLTKKFNTGIYPYAMMQILPRSF